MVSYPSLLGAHLAHVARPVTFGNASTPPEPHVEIQLDVSPDIHVLHTTTKGPTTKQQFVALKGRVQLDPAPADSEPDHPMLAFCRHLWHLVRPAPAPVDNTDAPAPQVPPEDPPTQPSVDNADPSPPADASALSTMQQLIRDVTTAFSQLRGKLRLHLDVDASQLIRTTKESKPVEAVLIPEAGVSGVRGRLNLTLSLQQAGELVTLLTALNHPERAADTEKALRDIIKNDLTWWQRVQLGLSRLFFARRWEQFIIREAVETKLNGLLPNSDLRLYRPRMQP